MNLAPSPPRSATERRHHPRHPSHSACVARFHFRGREYCAALVDISDQGACLALADAGEATIVARAVVDSVVEGVIPKSEADNYVIVCGVFIHPQAKEDTKIYDYNYEATKLAIKCAMKNEPKIDDIIAKKGSKHPFSPK